MKKGSAVVLGSVAALALVATARAQVAGPGPGDTAYSVKFVCGTQAPQANLNAPAEPPVKPGNYATVINVEGLNNDIGATAIVSPAGSQPSSNTISLSPLSLFVTKDITCADIAKTVGAPPPSFITGYVNIVDTGSRGLSVTAVYTSQGCAFPPILTAVGLKPVCSGAVDIDVVPQAASILPAPKE